MGDRPLYAFPSEVSHGEGGLDRKKSSLSDVTDFSELINEEFPDPMAFLPWGS